MNSLQESQTINKSHLMTAYNRAVHSGKFCRKRTNKALGILMSSKLALLPDGTAIVSGTDTYFVSRDGCDCPDARWRGQTCKHQLARYLTLKMKLLARQAAPPDTNTTHERMAA